MPRGTLRARDPHVGSPTPSRSRIAELEARVARHESKLTELEAFARTLADKLAVTGDVVAAPNPANPGGHPGVFPWEDFYIEIIRVEFEEEDGGIVSAAHLRDHMRNWIGTRWSKQPAERTLREKIAKVTKILNLA
jgi:hypothetical protein